MIAVLALEEALFDHLGESDLVVRDLKGLSTLVNEVLLPHESVARVRSSIVLHTIKQTTALPLPN